MDTPASSTTKTGRHDIAEILLKVTLNTINQIKSNLFTMKLISVMFQNQNYLVFVSYGKHLQTTKTW
jgi:hypothetical protein